MANLPTSNNNPGDLRDIGQAGATQGAGGFASFQDPKAGYAALLNDLQTKINNNPQHTLVDFASQYAPASDGNNPAQYAANLANQLGVAPNATLGSLEPRIGDLAQAVSKNEGYQGNQQENAVQGGGNVQLNPADLPAPQNPNQPSIPTGQSLPNVNGFAPPTPPAQSPAPQAQSSNGDKGFLGDIESGNFGGAAEDAGDFIAPAVADTYHDIKGDSTKTGLQQAGDWGSTLLSALALVPGLEPEALAAKAGLVGEEGLGVAGRIAANSALGAGFGTTNAIGAGETNPGQIAQSGLLGGAVGGGLGAAGEALGGLIDKYASKTTASQLADQTNRLKTLQKSAAENTRGATTPITTLLNTSDESGNKLASLLKVSDGKVDASGITNQEGTGALDNLIDAHSEDATKLVQSMKGGVPIEDFRTMAENEIKNDPTIRGTLSVPKALATLNSKLDSAEMSYGKVLPYTAIDEIRAGMNKVYNPEERDVARIIGDTSRKILYNGDGTNDAFKATMANESELIRAKNFAQKLHGTTVKGGRLGKYSARMLGGLAGGLAGKIGGPIGEAAGALGGAYVGDTTEDLLQKSYFNPISGRIAGLLKTPLKGAGKLANAGILRSVK